MISLHTARAYVDQWCAELATLEDGETLSVPFEELVEVLRTMLDLFPEHDPRVQQSGVINGSGEQIGLAEGKHEK